MTGTDYAKAIEAKLKRLDAAAKNIGRVVVTVHGEITRDVFVKGLDKRYSTSPMLVGGNVKGNTNRFGGKSYSFVTQAASNAVFSNPQRWVRIRTPRGFRNLVVLPGGYAQARRLDGRQTSRVDLNRSGDMFRDFAAGIEKTGPFSWTAGFRRKENVGKFEGHRKRYGDDLLTPDAKQKAKVKAAIKKEIDAILIL